MTSFLQSLQTNKHLIACLFVFVGMNNINNNASAQLLYADDYNSGYLPYVNVAGQNSWTKGGTGPDISVQNASPITYAGYEGSTGGAYIQMPNASSTSSRVYRSFTTTLAGTNTMFFSFIMNLSAVNATGDYFMSLGDPALGSAYFARVFAKSSGAGFNIGIAKAAATGTYGTTPTVYNFNQSYLVVVRFTFITGTTNDAAYVWVNPSLAAEPSTASAEASITTGTDPGLSGGNVGNFHWHNRGTGNPTGKFDGVRVAIGATSAAAWTNLAAAKVDNTVNGTITTGEYGTHFNSQNQFSSATATWYMNYDATNLYIGIAGTNTAEGAVLYLDKDPVLPVNGGNNSNGNLVGNNYDGSNFSNLQFRADLVMYFKDGYREYRTADGSGNWSGPTSGFGSYASASGTRELSIPWSAIGGLPANFNWFGYVAYAGGGAYASVPVENPGSAAGLVIGSGARWERYFTANTGSLVLPFARNCYLFNQTADQSGFGAINVHDFTMNASGLTLTRGTGSWVITGGLRIDAGTINFGAAAQGCSVGGSLFNTGTLTLSTAIGGDITTQGDIIDNGTFNANNRAVFFTGNNVQTIQGSGTFDISYVRISKTAGRVVLGSNLVCAGPNTGNAMEISGTNSILDLNGFTLTLGQAGVNSTYNSAVSPAGFIRSSPTSSINILGNGALGTILFDQSTPGTTNEIKNLTIDRQTTGTVTLGNTVNITAGASPNNEGAVTVTNGVLNAGGFLNIKSNANGTARVGAGNIAGGYISGNATVERFIPQNSSKAWRLLASNTTGQTINAAWQEAQANSASNTNVGFGTQISAGNALGYSLATAQTNGFDALSTGVALFKYNPATDGLESVTNTSTTPLASEPGYFIFIRGDRSNGGHYGGGAPSTSTVLRSRGSLFQGDQAVVTTGAFNYALVRNPYASRIDMRNIVRGSNMIDAYQVWDAKLGGAFGVGGYQTFAKSGSDYIVTPGGGSYGANGSVQNFIESGAAFFVQSAAQTNNTVQVTEACKATASSNSSFRPSTPAAGQSRLAFNLYANNTGGSVDLVDGGLVFFGNEYSNAVDVYDVRKSLNFNENFGMKRESFDLVVERRQQANINDTIFFHMTQIRQITYRLDIEATEIDPLITTAVLEDNYTNTITPLDLATLNAYTFAVDANAASRAANRFKIVFRQSTVVPVNFVSIKAAQAGNNIAVEWKVANEVNTVRYEVEKSTNGRNFATKGTVSASGIETYNWLDVNVVNGFNYYRIKSVDNNGQIKYSQVVKVQLGGKAGFTVSPNPVQGNFINVQINQALAGKYGIRLTNIAGQAVYNKEVMLNGGSASQSFALPSSLSSGVYQLELVAPDNSKQIEKIIIQGN